MSRSIAISAEEVLRNEWQNKLPSFDGPAPAQPNQHNYRPAQNPLVAPARETVQAEAQHNNAGRDSEINANLNTLADCISEDRTAYEMLMKDHESLKRDFVVLRSLLYRECEDPEYFKEQLIKISEELYPAPKPAPEPLTRDEVQQLILQQGEQTRASLIDMFTELAKLKTEQPPQDTPEEAPPEPIEAGPADEEDPEKPRRGKRS